MNQSPITIAVIAGTTRKQRVSIHAAKFVADYGSKIPNVNIIFVDPAEFTLPGDGNDPEGQDPRFTEITAKADAFFIVTPEYNHSFPGSLKRLIDSEYDNYLNKPVAIAGASSGPWGGVRAVEALLAVMRSVGLVPTITSIYFPYIQDLFNPDGTVKEDRYITSVQKAYKELIWMAKVLRFGRENIPKD